MPEQTNMPHGALRTPDFNRHRDWHAYALGSVLYARELRQHNAAALDGLLSLPPLQASILFTLHGSESSNFGEALARVLNGKADELEVRGRYASWLRRWIRYQAERDSWLAEDDEKRLYGEWRGKEMTEGQRELVRVTATLLGISIPEEMSRGQAADYLEEHGANLRYRRGD